jgi:hypothetical protein
MAERGLAWPGACGRWLPVRLSGISLATLMCECSRPEAAIRSRVPGDMLRGA